jgi:hypothetical protein
MLIAFFGFGFAAFMRGAEMEFCPGDDLYLELLAGKGYEAESIDDLMDQLQGRKSLRKIK